MTFSPQQIAICMITQYPNWYSGEARGLKNIDKVRGDLALESIALSVKKGYHTVIGYDPDSSEFNQALEAIGDVILVRRETKKSSPSKRQIIEKATELPQIKVIVLTEPEKVSFVKDCIEETVKPILDGSADIVIPKRDEILFKDTYPDYMYQSEKEGIALYNEELRAHGLIDKNSEDFDMFFGPRVLANNQEIVDLFLKEYLLEIEKISLPKIYFDADQLSNTQFFPVVLALKHKNKVKTITVPFHYPESQKQNETIQQKDFFMEKRRTQKLGLIIELMHFVSFLEKNQSSRVELV